MTSILVDVALPFLCLFVYLILLVYAVTRAHYSAKAGCFRRYLDQHFRSLKSRSKDNDNDRS